MLELAENGELFEYLNVGKLEEKIARYYFKQLISVIEYIHSKGIAHRDLKPENILLDEDFNLKLSDFGLSIKIEKTEKRHFTYCGTL